MRRHNLLALGALLEFAVEEFLSSWVAVIGSLLGKPFKPSEVRVSYPSPPHCEAVCGSAQMPGAASIDGVVELRFDAA